MENACSASVASSSEGLHEYSHVPSIGSSMVLTGFGLTVAMIRDCERRRSVGCKLADAAMVSILQEFKALTPTGPL